MAGCFAGLILLYTLFAKVFPVVAIWEIEEAAHATAQPQVSTPVGAKDAPAVSGRQ
jgi:hypothetical protein